MITLFGDNSKGIYFISNTCLNIINNLIIHSNLKILCLKEHFELKNVEIYELESELNGNSIITKIDNLRRKLKGFSNKLVKVIIKDKAFFNLDNYVTICDEEYNSKKYNTIYLAVD